jgi:sugar phosphate isomerase/epimerase
MKAGINLYTLRHAIKSEADLLATAIKLRDMGYSYMQFSGAPLDADMIKRVSDESGLPVIVTHSPLDRIISDTDALMEEHARFGCNRIGLGGMPREVIADESLCKTRIDELERAGERMAKCRVKFFYHNHHQEFYKHGGETVFDYILANTKYINFIADTYWLQFGGVDVCEYLNKLSGRCECIHLKDYRIESEKDENGKISFKPNFAPVGDGVMNFQSIVAAAKESGAEYFLVEQDNAPTFDDPFGEVERSIKYIREVL